jgi:hypothetical protein
VGIREERQRFVELPEPPVRVGVGVEILAPERPVLERLPIGLAGRAPIRALVRSAGASERAAHARTFVLALCADRRSRALEHAYVAQNAQIWADHAT